MAKSTITEYEDFIQKEGKVDKSGLYSLIGGLIGAGGIPAASTAFNKETLYAKGFEEVIKAIGANGEKVGEIDGYNIINIIGNPENLVDPLNPALGLKDKLDFSSVVDVFSAGYGLSAAGDAAAGALFAAGLYALIKDKKYSTALFGASTGAAIYGAVTASQYANALADMPFQIGGEGLVNYTSNNPQFAKSIQGMVSDLALKLGMNKTMGAVIAAIAGAGLIYSAIKNVPKEAETYSSDKIK